MASGVPCLAASRRTSRHAADLNDYLQHVVPIIALQGKLHKDGCTPGKPAQLLLFATLRAASAACIIS